MAMSVPARPAPGLDGVFVADTAVTYVGGETGQLVYRGYDIAELAPGHPYESTVHLLIEGVPPTDEPPTALCTELAARRNLPPELERLLDAFPIAAEPLDALRTTISAMGHGRGRYPPSREEGIDLIAQTPTALARFVRRRRGLAPIAPAPELGHMANFLYMLNGERPEPTAIGALDAYGTMLADHGMNASTFALRVVLSTQSDLFSAAAAALGALKGPIHGGAPAKVSALLDDVGSPDDAAERVRARLERKELLYGFGHRAYKTEDPRARILHELARAVAAPERFALAEAVERQALEALRASRPKARLFTNVEYYGAVVLEAIGLPRELFTPTFAVARTAGWVAHAAEQCRSNRLIRPDAQYTGPARGQRWPFARRALKRA